MTDLNRGRPVFGDIGRPSEPALETVTDDLRASEIVDGVPEAFLDAAVDVGWGMGFSHLRRQIAAVMPLHERMVRAKVSAEILAAKGTDPRFPEGWASTKDRDHAAAIALNGPTHPEKEIRS